MHWGIAFNGMIILVSAFFGSHSIKYQQEGILSFKADQKPRRQTGSKANLWPIKLTTTPMYDGLPEA